MSDIILEVENLSKQYRLGNVGTGTISHDLNRWWHKVRGKEDPYLQVGQVNDRAIHGGEYVWALKEISFQVKQGSVLGIIGRNGAGKSTLLKLLSRITAPTTGKVNVKGRIASLLEVGTGFHPELTGRENVFLNGAILGMTKPEIRSKFDEIVDFSGCAKYIDTPVKRYSSGMMVRLGFAVAAHLEPEILIVDEVLAVGDVEFQKKCVGKMKDVSKSGRTVLFVSHNMASIKALCNEAMILENGEAVFSGNVAQAVNKYISSNLATGNFLESQKSLISSKEVRFNQCWIKNSRGIAAQTIFYKEPFKIGLEMEVSEAFKSSVVDISVSTETEKILYLSTFDHYNGFINLPKGNHNLEIGVNNNLLPGIYFLNLGCHIHHGGGISTKALTNYCFKFEVSESTLTGENNYPFQVNFGVVFGDASWKINGK